LIKYYELEVHYHLGKGNIITDVLGHKAVGAHKMLISCTNISSKCIK
jgi:hypothetical protein